VLRSQLVSANVPLVAPYDGCIACNTGDTPTGLVLIGDAEFHMARLIAWGVPDDQAKATLHAWFDNWGEVETHGYRVCAECAGRADMRVSVISRGRSLPSYGGPGSNAEYVPPY
jgi:hypothetical protein